jgi:hypothetical protein
LPVIAPPSDLAQHDLVGGAPPRRRPETWDGVREAGGHSGPGPNELLGSAQVQQLMEFGALTHGRGHCYFACKAANFVPLSANVMGCVGASEEQALTSLAATDGDIEAAASMIFG